MKTNLTSIAANLQDHAGDLLPKVAMGIGIFVVLWIVAIIVSSIIKKIPSGANDEKKDVIFLLAKIVYISLVIIGVISGLGTTGVNIMPLITGLGLTGFSLGFAFKDFLSNILAGIMIIIHRPFILGDEITVSGLSGKIVNIDLRYTALTSDDKIYLIPNTTLLTTPITITNSKETNYHEKRFNL